MREVEEQKLAVAMVYIDNYDDVMESVDEIQGSLLAALIDKRVNQYFAEADALVKKYDEDKYFVVFKQMALNTFKENKFAILEDAKDVNIGNVTVTLSIGVGARGETYAQNNEFAKSAMDLALGRGGDQVVLKEKDEIYYFGGKARQGGKVSRVKARMKAQALQKLIQASSRVIVMGHNIPDADCFGASVGVYRAAQVCGKPAYIVMDEPNSSIRMMMDALLMGGGYTEDIFVSPTKAEELYDEHTLVMVVDVNRPTLVLAPGLLEIANNVVVFDHHRATSDLIEDAVLSYMEPYASSACEMIAEVLQYFTDDIRLSEYEADCVYAGVLVDTNNFMTKTGVRTFEAAAYLRRAGAEMSRVRRILQNDMEAYKARAEAVRNTEVYRDAFAISVCPAGTIDSPTVAGAQAANELLNIIGIRASFVMTEYKEKIYISARSIDEINVQIIMEKLGGGGHLTVAGAQLAGYSLEEVKDFIINTLDDMIEKGEIVL